MRLIRDGLLLVGGGGRFYAALLSALQQNHCAFVASISK